MLDIFLKGYETLKQSPSRNLKSHCLESERGLTSTGGKITYSVGLKQFLPRACCGEAKVAGASSRHSVFLRRWPQNLPACRFFCLGSGSTSAPALALDVSQLWLQGNLELIQHNLSTLTFIKQSACYPYSLNYISFLFCSHFSIFLHVHVCA